MTIEITQEEAIMISKALDELGTQRLNRAIERDDQGLSRYAAKFFSLAERFNDAAITCTHST